VKDGHGRVPPRPTRVAARAVLRTESITKRWDAVSGLAPLTFAARPGELVMVRGRSGSGKSTLLALLVGWCEPDAGIIHREGSWAAGDRWRLWESTAIVPQVLSPLAELSVAENVGLVLQLAGRRREEARDQTRAVLEALDLDALADRAATEISLGQQQRLAVARAIVARPAVLLADEPTSHQDEGHASRVLDAIVACARAGSAVIVASHDELVHERADQVVDLDAEAGL
jgi:putative ABC transport system ATP-binding protein